MTRLGGSRCRDEQHWYEYFIENLQYWYPDVDPENEDAVQAAFEDWGQGDF